MPWAFSTTAPQPPATLMPYTSTATNASDMTMDWMRSVVVTARKPPRMVYPTMTRAETSIAAM